MPRTREQDLEARIQAIEEVAIQLTSARDNNSLLNLIVDRATDLTSSDAAALYLRKDAENLEFVIARNHSLDLSFKRQKIRIDGESIAAYTFRTQKAVRIDDTYNIQKDSPFHFDPSFDKKTSYRTRSILSVPLVTSKNKVLGVLQIINKKNHKKEQWNSEHPEFLGKMPVFTDEDERLIQGFGALASANIEKTTLYEDIERILEGFLHASVKVIDERDPSTRGHSERVALMTKELAVKCSGNVFGISFSDLQIRELYYAGLLHDFGKIGVREAVLLKPDKLFINELLTIQNRLVKFESQDKLNVLLKLVQTLLSEKRAPTAIDKKKLDEGLQSIQIKFDELRSTIDRLNKPTVLTEDMTHKIEALRGTPYLENRELAILSIPRGSLTQDEKKEIEDHVTKTYRFLSDIPWTKDFSQLAEIAYGHHEKLDGTGYPRRLTDTQIPVQSKMMAICDIYDALVASDRPYKAALPVEKALDILHMEVKSGKLDAQLLEAFIQGKVFTSISPLLPANSQKKTA